MVSDQTKWMAEKLSVHLSGKYRQNFLKDLKHNSNHVVEAFTQVVEELLMQYVMETQKVVCIGTDAGDCNSSATYAKQIVQYMQDELLKDALAKIV